MQETEKDYQPLSLDPRAYRFFPIDKQEKTKREKSGTRFFFYGQITHDEYETRKLREFHQWIAKNKQEYDQQTFHEQKLLVFLSGNAYKPEKSMSAMKGHIDFRNKYLPPVLTPQIQKVLRSGFFYPCGRDFNFRPILVFNIKLIDFKQSELYLLTTLYVQEQIIKHMFIPGQVENWVIVYDLGGMGVTQLPINTIKEVLGVISSNYGGRLYKLYMVNAPGTIYFSWKAVSAFLDQITVDKVTMSKTNTDKKIFQICKPSQIEKKYGGIQPDRTQFFPFTIPQGEFDEKRLVNDQQYEKMVKDGKLKHNVIDPKYK